jgi:hypothetical protein
MFNTFFEKKAVYETMLKHMVDTDMPQMTIRGIRFACWVTKYTDTRFIYVLFIDFPQQLWLSQRASVSDVPVHYRLVDIPANINSWVRANIYYNSNRQ